MDDFSDQEDDEEIEEPMSNTRDIILDLYLIYMEKKELPYGCNFHAENLYQAASMLQYLDSAEDFLIALVPQYLANFPHFHFPQFKRLQRETEENSLTYIMQNFDQSSDEKLKRLFAYPVTLVSLTDDQLRRLVKLTNQSFPSEINLYLMVEHGETRFSILFEEDRPFRLSYFDQIYENVKNALIYLAQQKKILFEDVINNQKFDFLIKYFDRKELIEGLMIHFNAQDCLPLLTQLLPFSESEIQILIEQKSWKLLHYFHGQFPLSLYWPQKDESLSDYYDRVNEFSQIPICSVIDGDDKSECYVCYDTIRSGQLYYKCENHHVVCRLCYEQMKKTECGKCRVQIFDVQFINLSEESFKHECCK